MDSRALSIVAAAVVAVASLASGSAAVASPSSHVWHTAIEVPGTAALNRDGNAQMGAVSCAAVGNCRAGGSYTDGSGREQALVVSQT
jgi:hypothetical protein